MTTLWPSFASSMAMPRPMPRPAPVTRETGRSFMRRLRSGHLFFRGAVSPLARPRGQRIFRIGLHALWRSAPAQRLQRLVERFDEEVFAEHDRLMHSQIFVDVIDAAVQNSFKAGRLAAQIFFGKRAQGGQREITVGA